MGMVTCGVVLFKVACKLYGFIMESVCVCVEYWWMRISGGFCRLLDWMWEH